MVFHRSTSPDQHGQKILNQPNQPTTHPSGKTGDLVVSKKKMSLFTKPSPNINLVSTKWQKKHTKSIVVILLILSWITVDIVIFMELVIKIVGYYCIPPSTNSGIGFTSVFGNICRTLSLWCQNLGNSAPLLFPLFSLHLFLIVLTITCLCILIYLIIEPINH